MSCLSMNQEELNYNVKIIEEESKPITKESIEALGYACGEIQKCFTNGWEKSLENKSLKKDKKIEKLKGDVSYDENLTFEEHMEHHAHNMKVIKDKINEIIDYLMEDNK